MKFSKYISKAVTPVMALFQKQHSCLSNKATTICGYSVCSLRQVPVRHNRGGKSTENKVRLAPPTMCRLTIRLLSSTLLSATSGSEFCSTSYGIPACSKICSKYSIRFLRALILDSNFFVSLPIPLLIDLSTLSFEFTLMILTLFTS